MIIVGSKKLDAGAAGLRAFQRRSKAFSPLTALLIYTGQDMKASYAGPQYECLPA
jgi:hypothetical protein